MSTSKNITLPIYIKLLTLLKNFLAINRTELKLVIINGLILFCITFNYTILRNLKDTFVNTASGSGPEVTCFIKSWLVLPISIICFLIITRISNMLSRESIFYLATSVFLIFFFVFCYYLYPNQHALHPSIHSIQGLQQAYPALQWLFPIYGIWSYSLFYISAELWGSIMMSLLFWGYVNEITKTTEAKRFYPIYLLLANLGLIMAGLYVSSIITLPKNKIISTAEWYIYLKKITTMLIVIGVAAMALYKWSNSLSICKYEKVKAKLQLKFMESIKFVLSSSYLRLIAVLVVSYGMAINLIEMSWKKQLALYFNDQATYFLFMSKFSLLTGVTTILTIFFTKRLLQSPKWSVSARFTPIMVGVTGTIFFGCLYYKNFISGDNDAFILGASLSTIIIWVGALQNILSKSTKYALFDPSKEITYIPLNNELKMKGKAAVDVIGERLGKAGGSYIQQALLIVTGGSILSLTPILFVLIIFIILGWLTAVFKLNSQYTSLLNPSN